MWRNDGFLYTHHDPDVDAIFSVWQIYYFLNNIFDISIAEFSSRVKLVAANYKSFYPDFGVDIGVGMDDDHVKEGNFPIAVAGKVFTAPCASMVMASTLMPWRDFSAIKDVIIDIHEVDVNGMQPNTNNSNKHLVSIWGILGALQNSMDFSAVMIIID